MLAPKGCFVCSRIAAIVRSSAPDSVQVTGTMPSPPASDTAMARSGEAAIGACRIGALMPSIRQSAVVSFGIFPPKG